MTGMLFIAALLVAGIVHARVRKMTAPGSAWEMMLVYLLAAYCGILQITTSISMLADPDQLAAHIGFPPGNPIQVFAAFMLMAAGVSAALSIWLRGIYLVGPAVTWAVFFYGATYAHLYTARFNGLEITTARALEAFLTHGLVSTILLALLLGRWWGAQRARAEITTRVHAV